MGTKMLEPKMMSHRGTCSFSVARRAVLPVTHRRVVDGTRRMPAARRQRTISRDSALTCNCSLDSLNHGDAHEPSEIRDLRNGDALGRIGLAAVFGTGALPVMFAKGEGGGNGGPNDGGGGGDGGGGNYNILADVAAEDEEEEEEEGDEGEEEGEDDEEGEEEEEEEGESDEEDEEEDEPDLNEGQFLCEQVTADGLPSGPGVPTEEDLFAGLVCQPGFPVTKQELQEDLRTLIMTGLFANVDVRVVPLPPSPLEIKGKKGKKLKRTKRFRVTFVLTENLWQPIKSFNVVPSAKNKAKTLLIPQEEVDRVMKEVSGGPDEPTGLVKLSAIKNIVEGWYQKRGFLFGYISNFEGMETGDIVAKVVEGRVNKVSVVNVDDAGKPKRGKSEVSPEVVLREVPFKEGQIYNAEDSRKALRDVFDLNLFENVQILPRQNQKDETKVDVEVMVKERPMKTADVECEWALAPGPNGRASLVSIIPGGSLTFEHRNLAGKGRTASVSVTTQNFLSPSDDLGYRLDYKHPYVWGDGDPNRTALCATAFNSRRISGVFVPPPNSEDVPTIFVDRAGAKVYLQEQYSRNSKGTFGVVLEQVTTRDDQGSIVTRGGRMGPGGELMDDGPPTTLGDTGSDVVTFLQGSITRDTTYFLNGAPVGGRDIFLVDQGLGVGTGFPVFNRHSLTSTRYLALNTPKAGSSSPPVTLVVHGRYGGIVGDLASYDTFTLGGPHSARGFSIGELGAARRFVEGAVEVRVPVLGSQVYAFAETAHDLGSSKEVKGNPTRYFRRAGAGSSLGAGIKLGAARAEYATDSNTGRGTFFVRFGERF